MKYIHIRNSSSHYLQDRNIQLTILGMFYSCKSKDKQLESKFHDASFYSPRKWSSMQIRCDETYRTGVNQARACHKLVRIKNTEKMCLKKINLRTWRTLGGGCKEATKGKELGMIKICHIHVRKISKTKQKHHLKCHVHGLGCEILFPCGLNIIYCQIPRG